MVQTPVRTVIMSTKRCPLAAVCLHTGQDSYSVSKHQARSSSTLGVAQARQGTWTGWKEGGTAVATDVASGQRVVLDGASRFWFYISA